MKITKNNIKGLSFLRLCEAVNKGEPIEGLDEFASESQDADFTEETTVEETEGAEGTEGTEETEGETEETESDTVTVEISKSASLPEVLRTVAAALEGEEAVEDDTQEETEGETEGSEEEYVEDDTQEEDCESATKPLASEDEESVADTDTAMKTAGTKETKRVKETPAVNRKGTLDAAKLGDIVKQEGDAAVVKPTERKKATPAINRSKVATSKLTPGKRLTDVGKGK